MVNFSILEGKDPWEVGNIIGIANCSDAESSKMEPFKCRSSALNYWCKFIDNIKS